MTDCSCDLISASIVQSDLEVKLIKLTGIFLQLPDPILKILVNKCYEFCRKRRTTVDLADVQDFLPAPAADQTERLSLWQAVMALNCDLRAVVTLFYYEDLSIREISAVLGISEAAVKTRLSRGRSRLKQLLHEE